MIKGYLTTAEVANLLGRSDSRVRQLIISEQLAAKRIGRKILLVSLASVERYQQRKIAGNGKR